MTVLRTGSSSSATGSIQASDQPAGRAKALSVAVSAAIVPTVTIKSAATGGISESGDKTMAANGGYVNGSRIPPLAAGRAP